jgi:hypothetical protein
MRRFVGNVAILGLLAGGAHAFAQSAPSSEPPSETPPKHVFWLIPNFRTSPTLAEYKPISAREKFRIAAQDSFDRGTVALAAAFAGVSQLSNSDPSFGQGVEGYAKRFATSYGSFVIGNYMTEGVFPALLHQDPRYFRRGTGSAWSRFGYAVGQIVWTHTDSGGKQINFSEILGNSAAVAISMSYYPDQRDAKDAVGSLAVQLGVDAASNVLKEFWPNKPRHHK